jgi:putative SOS response-associated peptidase YedK
VAGLWDEWTNPETGKQLKSCKMIITEPNEFVAEVHDRMPVIVVEKDFEPWLRPEAGAELLKPASNDLLQKWPVSKRVNSSRADDDDPTLIARMEMALS